MKLWRTLLKNGGRILITTPNYHSAWPLVEWCLDHSGMAAPMQEHQHVWKPTITKLRELGEIAELDVHYLKRGFGAAPFLSVLGWNFASAVESFENRIGAPLGNLLCAAFVRTR